MTTVQAGTVAYFCLLTLWVTYKYIHTYSGKGLRLFKTFPIKYVNSFGKINNQKGINIVRWVKLLYIISPHTPPNKTKWLGEQRI